MGRSAEHQATIAIVSIAGEKPCASPQRAGASLGVNIAITIGRSHRVRRDMKTSSRLIPLVDDLTHILVEAGKNKLH
jgi:hypothetical protein